MNDRTSMINCPRVDRFAESLIFLRDRFGIQQDYEGILQRGFSRFVHPGDTVFDVGAHQGVHTQALVNLVGPTGRVIAFEPIPQLARQLRENFAAAGSNCVVQEVAIASSTGESSFTLAEGLLSESGLRERRFSQSGIAFPRLIRVRTEQLSEFTNGLEQLRYLKFDIEGGEVDAIRGGLSDLKRLRPIMSVEYGAAGYEIYGHDRRTLWDVAESLDYVIFTLFGQPLETLQEWIGMCDRIFWDWYLVPREEKESFPATLLGAACNEPLPFSVPGSVGDSRQVKSS